MLLHETAARSDRRSDRLRARVAAHSAESRPAPGTRRRRWVHPVTGAPHIDVNRDFTQYHLLDENGSATEREYVHPIERLQVARLAVLRPARFEDPAVYFETQRDFLRDFLAAQNAAMLISVVADRFVIVPGDSGIEEVDTEYTVTPNTSVSPR